MKNKFFRNVLLCGTIGLSLMACTPAGSREASSAEEPTVSESAAQDESREVNLRILASSDIHGKFAPYDYALNEESTSGSLVQIATVVKERRTENTLLVDVGDSIQGNSAEIFLEDDRHPMMQCFNEIGYDVWVPGNHEFNYGMDVIKKVMPQFDGAVLCGNVYNPDQTPLSSGYTIIEKGGVKIGVIGMVTPNIVRWDSKNLDGYTVTNPVEETRKIIDEIKDKTDVLIAAEHMGESNEYETSGSGVNDLAEACPELDVILAAHEHKQVEGTEVNGVLIVENNSDGKTLAQVDLVLKKDDAGQFEIVSRTSESITIADYAADEIIAAVVSDADMRAREYAETVIGTLVNGPLAPENEIEGIPQARLQETSLIDLINEVQIYYTGADISAAALFIDDANLDTGSIRKCDLARIYMYPNTLYKLQLTGRQLKKYMEWSASYYNTLKDGDLTVSFDPESRGYLYDMFSGINYEINLSKEPGQRIENLTYPDGTAVNDDDVFTLAVNNYRASSQLLTTGVIFQEGEELPVLLEMDVRGEIGGVRELIGDYIVNVKNGVLEAPALSENWRLTGLQWDEDLHREAVELLNSGKLSIKNADNGRQLNVESITVEDVKRVK